MRIGLIIADFESSFTTSFKYTSRAKYGVDFNSSNVDNLVTKLSELKSKLEKGEHSKVHVGFEITIEHVIHVQNLIEQILAKYKEIFKVLPPAIKIYTVNQKLRENEIPSTKELAIDVLKEVLSPEKPAKLTKKERIDAEAKKLSDQRALYLLRKNSTKG